MNNLDIKFLYKTYSDQIQYKIQTCSAKEQEYKQAYEYLYKAISENKSEFDGYGISVDNLLQHPYLAFSKISYLVNNGHLIKLGQYVKTFATAYRYWNYFKLIRIRLEQSVIPYYIYREVIFAINREIAKYILEGGIYTMGIVGKIFIIEKENIQYSEWSKPVNSRVDWGETAKNKKRLQAQGISLYNEKNNPTGTKYFKYHNNDYDYWWCWLSGAIHNRSLYRFYPNSYVHNMGRSVDSYVAIAKSTDQILNTTAIGNEDKMRALIKYDKLWYLRYRRTEVTGKKYSSMSEVNKLFLQSTLK